jgi:hypothetical protein
MLNIAELVPPSESVPTNSWNHFPPDSIYSQNQFPSIPSIPEISFDSVWFRIHSIPEFRPIPLWLNFRNSVPESVPTRARRVHLFWTRTRLIKFFWTRTRLIKIFGPGPDLLNIFGPGPGPGPGCWLHYWYYNAIFFVFRSSVLVTIVLDTSQAISVIILIIIRL